MVIMGKNKELNKKDAEKVFYLEYADLFGLAKYKAIMDNVNPLNDVFQKKFVSFYKLRGLDKDKLRKFFMFFDKCKKNKWDLSYDKILDELKKITERVEASFASKMLATLDDSKPILDQFVLKYLGLEIEGSSPDDRLQSVKKIYKEIDDWYGKFLKSSEGKSCVRFFNEKFPDYKSISDVKKIDCFLWRLGKEDSVDDD